MGRKEREEIERNTQINMETDYRTAKTCNI